MRYHILYFSSEHPPLCVIHSNKFAYLVTQSREFFLILRHNIAFSHHRIPVQIISDLEQFPVVRFLKFFHGEIEKRPVVRLEFKDSSVFQELLVSRKELP